MIEEFIRERKYLKSVTPKTRLYAINGGRFGPD